MLSSIAITLLPLIVMLSGCGSPELLAPALSEMPGISKSPKSQALPSRESQGQETAESQESRQLLATPTNPIPQSECSYQCSKLGFHNGGKCSNSYCRCLVEHREAKTLWNGWVSEGICSSISSSVTLYGCGDPADPYKCDFPSQRQSDYQHGTCGPPGFVSGSEAYYRWPQEWGYTGDRHILGEYDNGKRFSKLDICELWAKSFPIEANRIEKLKLGKDDTPVCVRFADISYACSA